ncbi:hypothetical protein Taro_006165 [Colocasia esculenta]|uniref:Uncharacterized protein n=1 Tax=Colocasia esculenta TaxID=4460 RepID=A0A843TWC8_COLES|nr:hypothetical protein [Colocasia esculenta]
MFPIGGGPHRAVREAGGFTVGASTCGNPRRTVGETGGVPHQSHPWGYILSSKQQQHPLPMDTLTVTLDPDLILCCSSVSDDAITWSSYPLNVLPESLLLIIWHFSDSLLRHASSDFKKMGQRIFIFIIGGATRSELRVIHKLTSKLKREVILGSSSLDDPPQFITKLKLLSEDISLDDLNI